MDWLDLTQHDLDRLASLGVLEAVERAGTIVKRPAKVIWKCRNSCDVMLSLYLSMNVLFGNGSGLFHGGTKDSSDNRSTIL